MKHLLYLFLFLFLPQKNWGQNLFLKIEGSSTIENQTLDSITSPNKHIKNSYLNKEITSISKNLIERGYIEHKILTNKKINDTTQYIKYELGYPIKKTHIRLGPYKKLLETNEDTVKIDFKKTNEALLNFTKILEKKGFPLTQIKLSNIKKRKQNLLSEITIIEDSKRTINRININGYQNFPKNHLQNIFKNHNKKVFNENQLKKINKDFKKLPFCKTTKDAEILFKNDSTSIYIYLEKQKRSTFDGYIGSTTQKNTLKLNGYLDLKLLNTLNWGEHFNVYWKNNGQEQTTFNLNIETPYIFKSPLILKGNLNIFKQDTTFQKTKSEIELGYLLNYNTRLYIGYQETESSDIQNANSKILTDYKNFFYTLSCQHINHNNNKTLFPEKTNLTFKIGTGKRNNFTDHTTQFFTSIELSHEFELNNRNTFFIKSQNYYLNSNQYLTNELFRYGGINSIRGFNDNSLQCNLLSSIISEYRYKVNSNLYIHSILDYAYTEDETQKTKNNLKSLGIGFYLTNKKNLIHIQYSNGISKNQNLNIKNSIFHISLSLNLQ
ncbi:BamA/TamA family outer membrane protein [Flavobacterium oreochromis]|uniref:BamA/TamA family outer membrane protein n=1 Tax=Flavobacterium oreochromis TaxID=2906078 RepID=UPI00385D98B1